MHRANPLKILFVTGGAGFIGANFIQLALTHLPDWQIINLDALTYAGNLENLQGLETHPRYRFIKVDIREAASLKQVFAACLTPKDGSPSHLPYAVIHFAAESHVDRSILAPQDFILTNVLGTQNLLTTILDYRESCQKFIQVSTDEVYGSLEPHENPFTENSPLAPNSPYAASKAAADLLVRAAKETYDLPTVITRCGNNYGPYQFPEKLIPLMITNALENKPLPVYGDGLNIRDWIFVEDHCRGIIQVLTHGRIGEVYNFGSNNEQTNLAVIRQILEILVKPSSLLKFVKDRPGHDQRYAIDASKAQRELNWQPKWSFKEGLQHTINWYLNNQAAWQRIKSGAYVNYYAQQYQERLSS